MTGKKGLIARNWCHRGEKTTERRGSRRASEGRPKAIRGIRAGSQPQLFGRPEGLMDLAIDNDLVLRLERDLHLVRPGLEGVLLHVERAHDWILRVLKEAVGPLRIPLVLEYEMLLHARGNDMRTFERFDEAQYLHNRYHLLSNRLKHGNA